MPCKACEALRMKGIRAVRPDVRYREKEASYRKNVRLNRTAYYLHGMAKKRAKRRGQEFTISADDIVIPQLCPILEIPLFTCNETFCDNSPSVDRIDTTKGYIPGNIHVISHKANAMKSNATPELLRTFCRNISKFL